MDVSVLDDDEASLRLVEGNGALGGGADVGGFPRQLAQYLASSSMFLPMPGMVMYTDACGAR
nr:hypothetical protein [Streptomyces sp. SM11]